MMHQPLFMPESNSIEQVFAHTQTSGQQMVVLVDKHGGASGIITLEDVVEEVFGEVADET